MDRKDSTMSAAQMLKDEAIDDSSIDFERKSAPWNEYWAYQMLSGNREAACSLCQCVYCVWIVDSYNSHNLYVGIAKIAIHFLVQSTFRSLLHLRSQILKRKMKRNSIS